MEGKSFEERIQELGQRLRIPEEEIKRTHPSYWEIHYAEIGANLKEADIKIVPTASVAAVSLSPNGKYCVLIEEKYNNKGEKQLKLPGGRSKMWSYIPQGSEAECVELENPMLTAYREWKEAVGGMLSYQIRVLTITTSRNDSIILNICYHVEVPWNYMKAQVFSKEEVLGGDPRIKIIPIEELRRYPRHLEAEESFELLMNKYT